MVMAGYAGFGARRAAYSGGKDVVMVLLVLITTSSPISATVWSGDGSRRYRSCFLSDCSMDTIQRGSLWPQINSIVENALSPAYSSYIR